MFNDDLDSAASITKPHYEPSGFDRLTDSWMGTFSDSYTGEIVSSVQQFMADETEKTVSGKFINDQLGLADDKKFDESEMFTEARANDLIKWGEAEIETDINQETGGYSFNSFIAALGGGFVADPLVTIAGTGLGRIAATGVKAYRTGVSFKAAKQILRKSKSIGQAFKSEVVENLVGTTIVDVPAMMHLKERRNDEFEVREALTMVAGSTLFGTAFSLGVGKLKGDFNIDANVEKKVLETESRFGSKTEEAVEAEMKYQDAAREAGSNVKHGHTEEVLSKSIYDTRKHQTPHEHVKVTNENIKGKKFYAARKSGKLNFLEVSNNGIGTTTLNANKNVVENMVQGIDGDSHGSIIEIDPENLKLLDGDNIPDDVKEKISKLGADIGNASTIKEVLSKMVDSKVDTPKETLASILRDMGYDGYLNEIELPNKSLDSSLTLLRDDLLETSKVEKDIDDLNGIDGVRTTSKKLNITNEKRLNPFKELADSYADTKSKTETVINNEKARMNDKSRNGTYINMKDKEIISDYSEMLDSKLNDIPLDENQKIKLEDANKVTGETLTAAAEVCGMKLQ